MSNGGNPARGMGGSGGNPWHVEPGGNKVHNNGMGTRQWQVQWCGTRARSGSPEAA